MVEDLVSFRITYCCCLVVSSVVFGALLFHGRFKHVRIKRQVISVSDWLNILAKVKLVRCRKKNTLCLRQRSKKMPSKLGIEVF